MGDEKLSHNPTDVLMTSGVILKKRMRVQELQIMGYTQEKIAEKLGTSIRTVQRAVEWLRQQNEQWFEDLANKNFVSIIRETLEGLKFDMVRLQEMLEGEEVQQDKSLQIKIIKNISEIRLNYARYLAQFPFAWSLDALIKKCSPQPIPEPTMKCLELK